LNVRRGYVDPEYGDAMTVTLTIAEQLSYSTIRIECVLGSGGCKTGTGFFYGLNMSPNQHTPVIVTNKHVIEEASVGRFVMTRKDDNGAPIVDRHICIELDKFSSRWTHHPDTDGRPMRNADRGPCTRLRGTEGQPVQ